MTNRSIILKIFLLLVSVSVMTSCILDPEKPPADKEPPPPVVFEDLKEKDDVLFNLELLFNEFNTTEYDKLLDDDYINFFSDADFSGGITPEQWDRATEVRSYSGFFDPTREKDRVTSRSLKLSYPEDNWTEITPDDPVQYPDESWYVAIVTYDMSVTLDVEPELTLVANGLKVEIIIRWDDEKGHYRMIRWRDDVESS